MKCSEAEQFFDAYLDGELAGSLRLEFDAHRLRCTVCQQKLAMMESCEHILARDTRGPLLSDDFTDRVMDEIEQRKVRAAHSRRRRIVIAAAVTLQAAAVIVFALLFTAYWNQPEPPVLNDPEFVADVEGVMGGPMKKVELKDLMDARLQQWSQFKNETAALARYLPDLSILDRVIPESEEPSNPLEILFPRSASPSAEDSEPEPDAVGSYSL
jgi:hypothetical protein